MALQQVFVKPVSTDSPVFSDPPRHTTFLPSFRALLRTERNDHTTPRNPTNNPYKTQVVGLRSDIYQMRDIRHGFVWPTMILCLGLIGAYMYTAVRQHRRSRASSHAAGASDAPATAAAAGDSSDDSPGRWKKSCGKDTRGRCFRVCTLVLALMVWMTAAGALTLSGEHLESRRLLTVLFFVPGQ